MGGNMGLTRNAAIRQAKERAKTEGQDIHVVKDDINEGYTTATDEEMDTFFQTSMAEYLVEPNGRVWD